MVLILPAMKKISIKIIFFKKALLKDIFNVL